MNTIITISSFEEAQILHSNPKCVIYNYLLNDQMLTFFIEIKRLQSLKFLIRIKM